MTSIIATAAGLALLYRDLVSSVGAWLWLLGLVGLVAAFTVREARAPRLALQARSRSDWLWLALAILTVLAAFALRLYRLDSLPPNLDIDEGEIGDWGLNVLHQKTAWGQHIAEPISPLQT